MSVRPAPPPPSSHLEDPQGGTPASGGFPAGRGSEDRRAVTGTCAAPAKGTIHLASHSRPHLRGPSIAAEPRIQEVLESIAKEVEPQNDGENREAGEGGHPPVLELGLAGGDHGAPLRSRRDGAEPDERQRCDEDDRVADIEGCL